MKAYSDSTEEALRARNLLEDWAGEGFVTGEQRRRMELDATCDLRRTNVFLRIVLFLFTLIIVVAAAVLFFLVFTSDPLSQGSVTGTLLILFAALSYAAAEFAVARARLYRYGIEEALAVCAVGFLCAGLSAVLFDGRRGSPQIYIVPAAGAVASLWIWRRFGLLYAFIAAMIFAAPLPGYWTSSHSAQHAIVTVLYTAGLIAVIARRHREYSAIEALLWLGIYAAINLQLSPVNLPLLYRAVSRAPASGFARPFYWATWVLIWCLPPLILARGIRRRDRFVIAAGAIAAVLTLITNKPYLGWARHTWDPMLLGALLIGVALYLRRWLAAGPDGVRRGFTSRRLSGKDKQWMSVGQVALAVAAPHAIPLNAQAKSAEVRFGGGDTAGGGATSDF